MEFGIQQQGIQKSVTCAAGNQGIAAVDGKFFQQRLCLLGLWASGCCQG